MARIAGVSLDKVAERFGVHRDAVWRHMDALPAAYKAGLIADIPREELAKRAAEESGLLLDHFKLVRNLVETQLMLAKGCGDHHAVATLTKAAIAANREVGKLTGEIEKVAHGGITINNTVALLDSAPFRAFERGLIEIAREFPDTKGAILNLIRSSRDAASAPQIEGEQAHAA